MEIKYFNSNFDKITQNKDTDQSITNLIEKLPSLNIVSDKNLLEETIKISNQFKEKKEKIIVFGTGGSNLGARALNNIISNNKMKKVIFVTVISIIFLSSCNTIRSSAGVERKVIDEYNVVENPPLVIPPNFNLLPPDQIESKDIDDTDSELAKEILFGLDEESDETPSENSVIDNILKETEADQVDNSIREDLDGNSEDEISQDNTDVESENIEEPKKKKRFFFFKSKEENEDDEEGEPKKKKRFFFF